MAKGKKKKNVYSVFLDEQRRQFRNQYPSEDDFQDFIKQKWERLPQWEMERYKATLKRLNDEQDRRMGKLDNTNASIRQRQEERDAEIRAQELMEDRIRAICSDKMGLANKKFLLVHCSMLCQALDGKKKEMVTIPAEGAVVEMSLMGGITRTYHSFFDAGNVPMGYGAECMKHAEKTHNVPACGLSTTQKDHAIAYKQLELFVMENVQGNTPPPLYCMTGEECEIVRSVLKVLSERAIQLDVCAIEDWSVYSLPHLFFEIEQAIHEEDDLGASSGLKRLPSTTIADVMLKDDEFRYTSHPSDLCHFHAILDNFEHCSKGIVRRRAYTMYSRLCDALDIQMVPGKHCPLDKPVHEEWEQAQPRGLQNDLQLAITKSEVNVIGTLLPRGGSRGGITNLPNYDPAVLLKPQPDDDDKSPFSF